MHVRQIEERKEGMVRTNEEVSKRRGDLSNSKLTLFARAARVIQVECDNQRAWAVTYGLHQIDSTSESLSQSETATG